MNESTNVKSTPFVNDSTFYNKPTEAIPAPERNIGIDTKEKMFQNIIDAGEANAVNISAIENFTNISQSRDQVYDLIDTMCNDTTIAAALEIYASDICERNDEDKIVWADSSDPDIAKYVNFLIDSLNIDKNIYSWAYALCKYGDIYLRLYRESEYKDDLFDKEEKKKNKSLVEQLNEADKEELNEDINVKAYSKSDKYAHYIEMYPNPAEVFELTKFGKTAGYIKANVPINRQTIQGLDSISSYRYTFRRQDISIFAATEFVHASLDDGCNRNPEQVNIFLDNADINSNEPSYTYTVKRGQSIFYKLYKIWRELSLLENSVLLNRLTKSSIIRLIGIEVGDMPKEEVQPLIQNVKRLIEQKVAINTGQSMDEYTNPGPVENSVYIPTHNGIGQITTNVVGGDVDVKSLADLDYFKTKLYSGLKIPPQYLGDTDDAGGFDGGTALSLISSRYAKMVKRIQTCLIQAITDVVNLMCLDKGQDSYVNKFNIHMVPPATTEEETKRQNKISEIQVVGDVMNLVSEIENPVTKLEILKELLSGVVTNANVIDLLQDEIDRVNQEIEDGQDIIDNQEDVDIDFNDDLGGDLGSSSDLGGSSMSDFDVGEISNNEPEFSTETPEQTTNNSQELPNPSELGNIDFTNNNQEF